MVCMMVPAGVLAITKDLMARKNGKTKTEIEFVGPIPEPSVPGNNGIV